MANSAQIELGSVVSLWRYPVKSMMGEELNATEVTERGLLGDRAYALIDRSDGKAATAKNPRKWPQLFDFRATFIEPAGAAAKAPPVRIALPDGTTVTSEQGDVNQILSKALNREVTLGAAQRGAVNAEEYWPDMEGLDHRDTVTDFTLPEGTFFDCAMVHLLTTATLDRLRELYPHGHFEVRRFRPNVVVQLASGEKGFAENAWIGHTLAIGRAVRLNITGPCGRCVMTTLAQGDLPRDPGILRTAAQHNRVNVGVYAAVVRGGTIRRGDPVRIEPGLEENTMSNDKKTLYERLGGYDAITAVANDLLARLRADPQLGRFWAHRGEDGVKREKQLLIDFLCASAGGPMYYRGRDMVLTHRGMCISESDWNVFLGHAAATLAKFQVPEVEQRDVVAFVQSLKKEIVE